MTSTFGPIEAHRRFMVKENARLEKLAIECMKDIGESGFVQLNRLWADNECGTIHACAVVSDDNECNCHVYGAAQSTAHGFVMDWMTRKGYGLEDITNVLVAACKVLKNRH